MFEEHAECGELNRHLQKLGEHLDEYLRFEHPDAMSRAGSWKSVLEGSVPAQGTGIDQVIADLGRYLIPNGSQIPKPGCTAYITTGATTVGTLASLSAAVAAPQRLGLTAFSYLEELSLRWLAEIFELPTQMQGIFSSGGSVANLIGLGAARQHAFEGIGIDPAADGVQKRARIYASSACHRSIHRAAAVLGLGRNAVIGIPVDHTGDIEPRALRAQLQKDKKEGVLTVAIVANAGCTCTGAIDPLQEIGQVAADFGIWFHVDGAYGLPGILDPQIRHLYSGLSLADSVIVDPHKWLGAPVGIGATFVRDRQLLQRAFRQGASDYLEGSVYSGPVEHSMDSLGIPYYDYGVELSAPCRGAVVWALIQEIGKDGLTERVCRHNAMAKHVALRAWEHPNLELLL
jgi:aromatic-L-amino-acid decarboxylase